MIIFSDVESILSNSDIDLHFKGITPFHTTRHSRLAAQSLLMKSLQSFCYTSFDNMDSPEKSPMFLMYTLHMAGQKDKTSLWSLNKRVVLLLLKHKLDT